MGETSVIGWDIGGAHLKAARVHGGRVAAVVQVACPLWQGLDKLHAAFAEVETAIGRAPRNAVTMTGELVDLFDSRSAGVAALTGVASDRLDGVSIYAGAGGFIPAPQAPARADDVASANWHATASLVAATRQEGLVIDVGSTTADVVPVKAGAVVARGVTDAQRMAAGELVYTGATRTPLMAVASRAPVGGAWTGIMAEHFATMADVNRLLGRIGPDDDRHPTADGRDRSLEASRLRLSRMVGRDVADLAEAEWAALADWFAESQIRAIHDAAHQVLSAAAIAPDAVVVACGIGRAAVAETGRRLHRRVEAFESLIPLTPDAGDAERHMAAACAPAVATGLLFTGVVERM